MKQQEEKKEEKLRKGLNRETAGAEHKRCTPLHRVLTTWSASHLPTAPPKIQTPHSSENPGPDDHSDTQQAQALMTTLTPQQAQALGTTLTTQQAEALRTTLTPQQAQTLGTTLTPPKAKAIRPLTPQMA